MIRLSKALYITIGSVGGRTRGAGNELALALDLRYASLESAYFGQPEVGIGILPGGGTERLPRLLGRDCALEAIRTSSDYGAAQAERWGWVTRALPDDQLDAFVDDMVAGWPSRTPRPSPRPRPPSIDNLLRAQDTVTAVVSRWIAAAGDPDYRDAFLTILKDPMIGHRDLINVRSRGAQGNATASRTCDVCRYGVGCGFGLPIDLDPTILSTGLAGLNPIRDIANVRTTVLLAEANSTSTTPSGWRAPAPTSPGGILNIGGNGGLITTQRVQTATTAVTVLADITPSSNPSRQPGSCERHLGDARERHRRVLPLRGVGQYERASDLLARSQRSAARHAGFGVVNDPDEPHDHESATSDLGDWSGFTIVDRLDAQIELIPHLFGATNRFPTGAARDLVHLAIFVGCHQAERAALDLLRIAS